MATRPVPDILRRICQVKRQEIKQLRIAGEEGLLDMVRAQGASRGFRAALTATPRVALIAELKKASPSAGLIRPDFDPARIARCYEQGGARCLSVLTDKSFFHGAPEHLRDARAATDLPVLRKDFILSEIQVLEARAWGADCVLLIVAALGVKELAALLACTREHGMDALVEVHDEEELETALATKADMIGINNRDLHTFKVDIETACRLAPAVPEDVVVVAESGIKSRADVEKLKACGVRAVLVGETLLRAEDLAAAARGLSDV